MRQINKEPRINASTAWRRRRHAAARNSERPSRGHSLCALARTSPDRRHVGVLKNLRTLIDKADRDKAANPLFLKDLRTLADQYGPVVGWPVKLLYDDFQDGQYTSNPAWTVTAREWQVANVGSSPAFLRRVRLPNASGQTSNTAADLLLTVLGAVVNQQNNRSSRATKSAEPGSAGASARAATLTPVAITDQFSIKLVMLSGGEQVAVQFRALCGQARR